MTTETKTLTQEELNGFIGTELYYKHWLGRGCYTDGVQHMAERAGAHWLIDAVYSYQCKEKIKVIPFQLWELKVENKTAVLTMKEDTNEPELVRQEIEYTDFPLDYIKLYLIDEVLLLPSEY